MSAYSESQTWLLVAIKTNVVFDFTQNSVSLALKSPQTLLKGDTKHSCSVLYHMMTHPDHSERLQTNISPLVLLVWVKVSAWKIIGQHIKLCIGFCQVNKGHSEGDRLKVNLDIYQSSFPEFLLFVLKNSKDCCSFK